VLVGGCGKRSVSFGASSVAVRMKYERSRRVKRIVHKTTPPTPTRPAAPNATDPAHDVKVPVHCVLVVCKRRHHRHHQAPVAPHLHVAEARVGVLPEHAGVLLVQADGVADRYGFALGGVRGGGGVRGLGLGVEVGFGFVGWGWVGGWVWRRLAGRLGWSANGEVRRSKVTLNPEPSHITPSPPPTHTHAHLGIVHHPVKVLDVPHAVAPQLQRIGGEAHAIVAHVKRALAHVGLAARGGGIGFGFGFGSVVGF